MRHRVALKKLNADTQHRVAMRRNLARSLFQLARNAGKDGQDTSCMTDFWAEANGRDPVRL